MASGRGPATIRRMPRAATISRLAFGVLALADVALAGAASPRAHRARRVTKPLLMPVLAASFVTDPRSQASPLRRSTQAGQLFGWLGDLALLGSGTGAFAAGIGAFGVGQASYISGFRSVRNPEPLRHSPIGRIAAGLFAVSAPPMAWGAYRKDPVLGPGVLGYAALLTAMAAHAAHLDPRLAAGARRATALGGAAFLASDTLLGARQFVLTDPPSWLESGVMATYTAAQYLLAEGALRAAS